MAQRIVTAERTNQRLTMSYDEFLAWADEDTHAEWVDGEVMVFLPPVIRHQRIVVFLTTLLELFSRLRDLGEVYVAPTEMRLPMVRSAREPDILFVSREHGDRVTERRIDGPADLVIEIVFDDSVTRDRREKLLEYQRAGVPEYWIVDARDGKQLLEPFTLTDRGVFHLIEPDRAGRVASVVIPGLWIDPAWLWHEPLPNPLRVLQQIVPDLLGELNDSTRADVE